MPFHKKRTDVCIHIPIFGVKNLKTTFMYKITALLFLLLLSKTAWSQGIDISLSGSYYSPATKEVILIKWNSAGGYIDKVMYAKGTGKFVNMQIMTQRGDMKMLDYSFKMYDRAKPNIVFEAVIGTSPGGISLGVTTNKNDATLRSFSMIRQGDYEIESAKFGVASFVRSVYWKEFKNEANNATLAAEDSQEGTANGQLYFTYTDPAGKQEYFTATVNPITHQLTFTSKSMGKVRCELDNEMHWVVRMYNAQNKKIGDFHEVIK